MGQTQLSTPLRKPVIAGNWKMNKGPTAAREFFREFISRYPAHEDRTVIFFPPAVSLLAAVEATRERPDLLLGVQNIYWKPEGAFTGEISAPMARDAGARFTLVGHSERRHLFRETDEDVRLKTVAAFEGDLIPVICVGETLDERRAERVEEVILQQLDAALAGLPQERIARLVIAYEPVWAIGTGVNATPEDASAAHAVLRRRLAERVGEEVARGIPILYGGSVKPENAADLLGAGEVDGLLVGGASLDPVGFARIAGL